MDWSTIAAAAFILIGAGIMLRSIFRQRELVLSVRKSVDEQSRRTKGLVVTHSLFMGFFFLAYLVVVYLFIEKVDIFGNLFIASIFFFGAIFVYMGIVIQSKVFGALSRSHTDLQAYARKLEEEQKKLISLNEKLQQETDGRVRAEEADQMKSDFLSLVSHELRTPLTSIFGFTKLIRKDINSLGEHLEDTESINKKRERVSNNLNIVCNECNRLTRLVNNVLDLARIESGQATWQDEEINLREIVDGSVSAVEGLFMEKQSVSFKLDAPDDLPDLMVDKDLFTQVFVNLINNAVKFTDDGDISLRIRLAPEEIRFVVEDEGAGISSENLHNVFDKFYIARKGNTLGNKQLGTGLGLPICKQIVEHYGGRIWVESELGKGSLFHISIPRTLIVE